MSVSKVKQLNQVYKVFIISTGFDFSFRNEIDAYFKSSLFILTLDTMFC